MRPRAFGNVAADAAQPPHMGMAYVGDSLDTHAAFSPLARCVIRLHSSRRRFVSRSIETVVVYPNQRRPEPGAMALARGLSTVGRPCA